MSQNVYINSISKYKTFVYDRVETNAGSGYDVNSGKFTAPERGLYVPARLLTTDLTVL